MMVTILIHAGTARQRAYAVVPTDRPDKVQAYVDRAVREGHPGLALLHHDEPSRTVPVGG